MQALVAHVGYIVSGAVTSDSALIALLSRFFLWPQLERRYNRENPSLRSMPHFPYVGALLQAMVGMYLLGGISAWGIEELFKYDTGSLRLVLLYINFYPIGLYMLLFYAYLLFRWRYPFLPQKAL
jgi:hypothetical protein